MARIVLLADDSVTAQNMGRRILMDAGYEVVTVNNGSAALKRIHESKPDLIVLDVYMPGYGGLEVCQRLKENVETMKIPVLLTVGKMEPFKTDEAKRVRADAHIVKPFDASELLAALTRLEDRIVPQAEPAKKSKSESKKARSWHARSEDPAAAFNDSDTEQIAYLAEVKKRQQSGPICEPDERSDFSQAVDRAENQATSRELLTSHAASPEEHADSATASIARPMGVPEFTPEPTPEFAVETGQQNESTDASLNADARSDSAIHLQAAAEAPVNEAQAGLVEPSIASDTPVPRAEENKSRWVAENVPLTPEEAALELDREMRDAQVAIGRQSETVDSASEASPGDSAVTIAAAISKDIPAAEDSIRAVAVSQESDTAAFAAAASVSSAASTQALTSSQNFPASETAAEPVVAAETAAAWENWQHIRDSVMSPQATAALAESVAELAQTAVPEIAQPSETSTCAEVDSASVDAVSVTTPSEGQSGSVDSHDSHSAAASATVPDDSTDEPLEGDALSSIVDSVLAELKPKLMQEIARKLKK